MELLSIPLFGFNLPTVRSEEILGNQRQANILDYSSDTLETVITFTKNIQKVKALGTSICFNFVLLLCFPETIMY